MVAQDQHATRPSSKVGQLPLPTGSELENYCKGNDCVKSVMCVQFGFTVVAIYSYSVFTSDMDINYLTLEYIVLAQFKCTPKFPQIYTICKRGDISCNHHLFKQKGLLKNKEEVQLSKLLMASAFVHFPISHICYSEEECSQLAQLWYMCITSCALCTSAL